MLDKAKLLAEIDDLIAADAVLTEKTIGLNAAIERRDRVAQSGIVQLQTIQAQVDAANEQAATEASAAQVARDVAKNTLALQMLLVVIDPDTDAWLRSEAEEQGALVAELAGEMLETFVDLIRNKRQADALQEADKFRQS